MRYCDICKNNKALPYLIHRDLCMCYTCAEGMGWVYCIPCNLLHHPSTSHHVGGIRCCDICWNKDQTTCNTCSKIWPTSCLNNELQCPDCQETVTFSHPTRKVCDSYVYVQSTRHYGIELETYRCENHCQLKRQDCWGAKFDETIEGMEFDSPKFRGDCGFKAISDICEFAKHNNWEINNSCGYHLHIDLSQECARNLRAVAYAYDLTNPIWRTLVEPNRENNTWCNHDVDDRMCIKELKNIGSWLDFTNYHVTRHTWINWAAYYYHGTLEIRSHEGTLDEVEICNWVNAHLTFVDWAIRVGEAKVLTNLNGNINMLFDKLINIWCETGCEELGDYYAEKSTLELRELV